jgi:glucuronoarabinoxylan endo-1,4-beta-xylanase
MFAVPDFFLKAHSFKFIQSLAVTMYKLFFLTAGLSCGFFARVPAQDIPVSITTDSVYQTIKGFGGFGAKKVWWDNPPYYDQEYLTQVIDTLGCSFIRTQIYWDAETVNDNSDPASINWNRFDFTAGSDNGKQFSFIRDLGAKGVKLLATVWTPPIWMKGLEEFHGTLWGSPVRRRPSNAELNSNCSWCGGASGCQQVGGWLKPEYYAEFAEYLVAYVKKVKEQTGVDVWGINIQNEPYFPNPFESCVVIPEEYADILKAVGERFASEGIATRLFGPEHMGEVSWGLNNEYIKEVLEDETVKSYLAFYAVHSYVDGVAPNYGSAEGWTALSEKIVKTHGKELWMTETSDFEKQGYDLGFSMAKSLYLGLKFGQISGWIYWVMADFVINNNRLTPLGRAFQQYYRFLTPGTIMVKTVTTDKDLLVVAGKKEDNLVIIIINNSAFEKTIRLEGNDLPSEYHMYRTSVNEHFKQLSLTGLNGIIMKPNSITTLSHTGLPTMIKEAASLNEILVYPNPAQDKIFVRNGRNCYLTLHDFKGGCVLTQLLSEQEQIIHVGMLQPGIYMVTLTGNEQVITQKLTIIN